MEDVSRAGRGIVGFELASLVVGEDVLAAVASDREAKAETLRVARCLLQPVRCILGLALGLQDRERHPPQPEDVVGDDALRVVVHRRAGQVNPAGSDLDLRVPFPSRFRERRLDEFSAGLSLVAAHRVASTLFNNCAIRSELRTS